MVGLVPGSAPTADVPAVPPAPPCEPTPAAELALQFEKLLATFREARPKNDTAPIEKAYAYASQFHTGQLRVSGEPYMMHPVAVAQILAGMRMDAVSIESGLLHDIVEDTAVTLADVQKNFGDEVARCVDGVTKLNKIDFFSAEDRQAESYRKMLLAMVDDIRVIIVKLADRLHNMRTLACLSPERRERIARETLEIYSPIAHRLGMGKVRGELEDLAFQHLDPEAYAEISKTIESQRASNEEYLERMRRIARPNCAAKASRPASRPRQARLLRPIRNSNARRSPSSRFTICSRSASSPIPSRTVTEPSASSTPSGAPSPAASRTSSPFPAPISISPCTPPSSAPKAGTARAPDPRRRDASHRRGSASPPTMEVQRGEARRAGRPAHTAWLRQPRRVAAGYARSGRLHQHPEARSLSGRSLLLHPQGPRHRPAHRRQPHRLRVRRPLRSRQHLCRRQDQRPHRSALRYTLRNGDIVDILTQASHLPSKDRLSIARTSRARNKIKHVINANERERAIEIGQKMLEKEARRLGVQMARIPKADLEAVAAGYGLSKIEDLYASLGYGKFSARQVLQKSAPEQVAEEPPAPPVVEPGTPAARRDDDSAIKVHGVDDVMVYRAKCCNPIKGESIVGYVTRGKGIAVHSKTCPNVQNLMYDSERKIEVEWERHATDTFPVRIVVQTDDRPGLLHQLTTVLAGENTNVRSLEAKTDFSQGNDAASVEMTVDVRDKKQLEKLCGAMRRISGVRDMERMNHQ